MKLRRADNGELVVDGLPEDALKKLTEPPLPGLSIRSPTQAQGRPDVIAASLKRLRLKTIQPPPWEDMPAEAHEGLRSYQGKGVEWLCNTLQTYRGAVLADDMGLGKTLQAITVTEELVPADERVLIAAPAAARETWVEELAKWAPGQEVYKMEPGRKKKGADTARWVISSYDLIASGATEEECFPYVQPYAVIMDEAHRLKGRKAGRSKALAGVCANAMYRLALTGTPLWDRPRDLWMLLRIVLDGTFGNQWDFDVTYCGGKMGEHGWENAGQGKLEELRARLQWYMLRREKAEVATDLPSLTRTVRWIEGTAKAKAALQRLELGLSDRALHAALLTTLEAKMDEAMDLAAEAGRFVLTTWLREHAHRMCSKLNERGVRCQLVTGAESTQERQRRIKLAREKGEGIVATTDSISEAINMQGVASQGIVHALDYVGTKLAQLEARLHRIGQKDPVTWTYVAMQNSADQLVVRTVVNKLEAFAAVVGATEAGNLRAALNANENGIGAVDERAMMSELAAMLSEQEDDDD